MQTKQKTAGSEVGKMRIENEVKLGENKNKIHVKL